MKRVVLYGKSLVMSTIGASLQGCPDIQLFLIDPSMPDVQDHLRTLRPDVVILDQSAIQSDFSVGLWKVQPELLLIGLDLMSGKALVLSSQPARLLTTTDLLQLLRHDDLNSEIKPGTDSESEQE
jgi:GTP:adenosylcobinamide-phosphate guanylyltransferase